MVTRTLLLSALLFALPARAEEGLVTIQVEADLELAAFIDQMAKATQKVILYDPANQRIRGQRISGPFVKRVPASRLFDTFRAILAFHELRLVAAGPKGHELYHVVDSRSTNNFIKGRSEVVAFADLAKHADRDGVYIQCAVPVRHVENMTTLRTALSTLVSPAGIGRVHEVPGSHHILISDFAPIVAAMARLVTALDVPSPVTTRRAEFFPLKHADAVEVAAMLEHLVVRPVAPAAKGRPVWSNRTPSRIRPYRRRNAIAVVGSADDIALIRALIQHFDVPGIVEPTIEVVRLENARATELAPTVARRSGAEVIADRRTNALVIAGSSGALRLALDLVRELDRAPEPASEAAPAANGSGPTKRR